MPSFSDKAPPSGPNLPPYPPPPSGETHPVAAARARTAAIAPASSTAAVSVPSAHLAARGGGRGRLNREASTPGPDSVVARLFSRAANALSPGAVG